MLSIKILLASSSPRRRQMLGWAGFPFDVEPASIDETPLAGEDPATYVQRLAKNKAMASSLEPANGRLVLAADTIVADGSQLLGKPCDKEDAVVMLRNLRGRSHQVYTAIAFRKDGEILSDLCVSQVPMRAYSDLEIDEYVASGDPLDKAGAYAIQNQVFRPVINFSGCFASVTGLPLCHLLRTLRKAGHPTETLARQICQEQFDYNCPISERVLAGENAG